MNAALRLALPGLALLAGGCGAAPLPAPAENVVVVVLDAARAELLSCYGNPRVVTPHLDGLARNGTRFERAYTCATRTAPALEGLLGGAYPPRLRARDAERTGPPPRGGARFRLGELLSDSGRRAGAFVGAAGAVAFAAGFPAGALEGTAPGHAATPEETIDRALAWLDEAPGPFALLVHLAGGGEEPEDARLAALDRQVARLLVRLEHGRAIDRTLLVVVALRGSPVDAEGARAAGPLSEGELRVPLLVRGPGLPRGRAAPDRVRTVDVLPTLVELLRLRAPPVELDGRSLAPMLRMPRRAPQETREVYAEGEGASALLNGTWKLVDDGRARSLFDLSTGALERREVSEQHPSRARVLERRLAELAGAGDMPGGELLSPEEQRMLEALRESRGSP